jgi:hypothetical protein
MRRRDVLGQPGKKTSHVSQALKTKLDIEWRETPPAYACGAVTGLFLTVQPVGFYNSPSRRMNSSPDIQVRSTQ